MAEIDALFWDNGGVILTNGWDRGARQRAVEKFHLDWDDFADRYELMLNAFETGQATLGQYLQRPCFAVRAISRPPISRPSCSRNRNLFPRLSSLPASSLLRVNS